MSFVSAVILAAGTSSRMGRAKQLLPLGDSTVLAQTLTQVHSADLHEIVLVLGASAEAIERDLTLWPTLKIVINAEYQQGIAASVRTGLGAVDPRSAAALIILGDQPFVRPETLTRLVDEYRRSRAKILMPTFQGKRGNPVLLDRALFPEARELQGDVGFRALFIKHLEAIVKLEVEDPGILLDLDEPSDYERLRKTNLSDDKPFG